MAEQDVGFLGILTDGNNRDHARQLLADLEIGMETIILNEELYNQSFANVLYIPYIYFVDNEGEVIGTDYTAKQDYETLKQTIESMLTNN